MLRGPKCSCVTWRWPTWDITYINNIYPEARCFALQAWCVYDALAKRQILIWVIEYSNLVTTPENIIRCCHYITVNATKRTAGTKILPFSLTVDDKCSHLNYVPWKIMQCRSTPSNYWLLISRECMSDRKSELWNKLHGTLFHLLRKTHIQCLAILRLNIIIRCFDLQWRSACLMWQYYPCILFFLNCILYLTYETGIWHIGGSGDGTLKFGSRLNDSEFWVNDITNHASCGEFVFK